MIAFRQSAVNVIRLMQPALTTKNYGGEMVDSDSEIIFFLAWQVKPSLIFAGLQKPGFYSL